MKSITAAKEALSKKLIFCSPLSYHPRRDKKANSVELPVLIRELRPAFIPVSGTRDYFSEAFHNLLMNFPICRSLSPRGDRSKIKNRKPPAKKATIIESSPIHPSSPHFGLIGDPPILVLFPSRSYLLHFVLGYRVYFKDGQTDEVIGVTSHGCRKSEAGGASLFISAKEGKRKDLKRENVK